MAVKKKKKDFEFDFSWTSYISAWNTQLTPAVDLEKEETVAY